MTRLFRFIEPAGPVEIDDFILCEDCAEACFRFHAEHPNVTEVVAMPSPYEGEEGKHIAHTCEDCGKKSGKANKLNLVPFYL